MSTLARYLDPRVIQQVARLDLRARFIVEGYLAGLHRSPFSGRSVEFAEHRKYAPGDDLRTIDWSVFARTDRLFVRKYQAETHLACHLLVDASASMGRVGPLDGPEPPAGTKLLYAIHLAAALGYLVLHQQDAIGLGIITDHLQTLLPPRSRRTHLVALLGELAAVEPAGPTGLVDGIHAALTRIPHRGVVVILSDLLCEPDALRQALHHVRYRGHDLIVMHILDQVEVDFALSGALRLEDPEGQAPLTADADAVRASYRTALAGWRGRLRDELAAVRADYVPLSTATPFDRALTDFLMKRGRRR